MDAKISLSEEMAKYDNRISVIEKLLERLSKKEGEVTSDDVLVHQLIFELRTRLEKERTERRASILESSCFESVKFTCPSTYHYMKSGVCHVLSCDYKRDDCVGCPYSVLRCYAARDLDRIEELKKKVIELTNELNEKQSNKKEG